MSPNQDIKVRIFISDLHLSEKSPQITARFLQFLEKTAPYASELYIMGDLFEVWVGDDNLTALNTTIINALKVAADKGIKIFFQHGNRDFLLGEAFAAQSNIIILPEEFTISTGNITTVLAHGDSLCTDDKKYQAFRKKVRHRWFKKFYLALPLSWRHHLANKARNKSISTKKQTAKKIMDVTDNAVIDILQRNHAQVLIHGHTHLPDVHKINIANKNHLRIVLSDWGIKQGQMLILHDAAGEIVYFDEAPELPPALGKVKEISCFGGFGVDLTACSDSAATSSTGAASFI